MILKLVEITLLLMDIASLNLLSNYVGGALGVIVVFDLSNLKSFYSTDLEDMIQITRKRCDAELILAGNKTDLITSEQLDILMADIQKFKDKFDITEFVATSAKTGENIERTFEILLDMIISKKVVDISDRKKLLFKICLIGLRKVGKTAIMTRYCTGKFDKGLKLTIGSHIGKKSIQYEPKKK